VSLRLKGKRALVTGSSKGNGAAIAKVFAKEGATVVVNYRASKAEASSVVEEIGSMGGKALLVQGDVSKVNEVNELFSTIRKKLRGIDILVNNAGYADGRIWNAPLGEIDASMWSRVFEVDVFGAFYCCQKAVPLMGRGGAIVNVSSTPAIAGDKEGLVYACAKSSVLAMTKMLSRILAPKIRVNCMVLGSFETSWTDWLSSRRLEDLRRAIPLGRFGSPEEVANLALFLASDESSYITGQGIVIDGGEVTH
jgi:3-oxoacyl-[acyl-carrier protein] reductase